MVESLRELAQVSKEDLILLMEAGYSETYNKHFDAARTIFEGVRAIRPESDIPLIGLSELAVVEGDRPRAFDCLREALAVDPQSAMAYARLGELYYEDGNDEKARAHFDKAVALDKDSEGGQIARLFLDGIADGSISRK